MTGSDGCVQLASGDQPMDCPFVRAVFVPLTGVLRRTARVEAAGFAVPQFMGKMDAKGNGALQYVFVYADAALPGGKLNRHRSICGQIRAKDLNAALLCQTV